MRFSESAWINKPLRTFTEKITTKNKDLKVTNVISNSANLGLISQTDYFDKEIANQSNIDGYYIINKGDFVYNPRKSKGAPYGPINIYRGETTGVVSPLYLCFKVNSINKKFLYYYFKGNSWHRYIYLNGDSGARSDRVSIKDDVFFNIPIRFPDDSNQKIIANFFDLIEDRINTQIKIIDTLLSEMNSIRSLIFNKPSLKWIPLKDIVAEQNIKLKRGKVIPKHKKNLKYIYPVYSSSITNSGLMGYSDSYMFNQELITWSIDGGGNFFYRKKHKFNITNVSGYMILNENLFNYQFIVQSLIWQHEKLKFDYQTKAHPSVVESLYKIPIMDLEEQHKYACLFSNLNEKYELELHILDLLNMQKKYLLKNMFV